MEEIRLPCTNRMTPNTNLEMEINNLDNEVSLWILFEFKFGSMNLSHVRNHIRRSIQCNHFY